ncbi:MAG: aspartyl/glutamyl-tRNA(Asn/Gln) amidotransferase subunit aspartyl-tRNA(Asn)/glutamyl-tRNA (Gln) [Patescibacteria group bacterium]|jgi:aspartyl-tRNA(Asn)/glutamyl-tRNA(Gln) amidotransferase subunit B|nr:aspartyl/glutamyl-tRNA(Asn/Gln) amidotransferase subunit aspartyl-tRNA(Asn)/glutamyl-tRNA (Gln) [Patescibacteria group bacterium]
MSTLPFSYIIGLEVHCELSTETKMFCRCKNQPFGVEPNQNTCPICLALPGTLPVPNKEAIRKTIIVGKALGSEISRLSKFDRKHYFYPDLPKGYQISQYDMPFCVGGSLDLLAEDGSVSSTIEFERVHLEEDAGKLQHTGKSGYSKVDLNRAGVPLIEMVTKPVLRSPEQARSFMQELRLLIRSLGVSEADMEKGHMRCDVNVSITFEHEGETMFTPITEVKNVNSTRAVERCLVVEGQRLYGEWMANGPVRTRKNKITAGWDEDTNSVQINRAKEAAKDYRYFPEPDIPPMAVYDVPGLNPDMLAKTLPELPNARRLRYLKLGLLAADIDLFLQDPEKLDRFEGLLAKELPAKQVSNWLINIPATGRLSQEHFAELLELVTAGEISFSTFKERSEEMAVTLSENPALSPKDLADKLGILQKHDDSVVQLAIAEVFAEQPQAVQDFKDGKEKILGFIVGQVMKKTAGKAQPQKVQEAVRAALTQ